LIQIKLLQMKFFFLIFLWASPLLSIFSNEGVTEPFKTVTIGNQIWMAENWSGAMPKSWFYDNDSATNEKYGRLYYWSNAVIAPKGWHLPKLEEWQELINHFGGDTIAATQILKGGSSGLNLFLAGHKSANNTTHDMFDLKEHFGYYWTSTSKSDQTAYAIEFRKGASYVVKNYFRKANGFSVRFVKTK